MIRNARVLTEDHVPEVVSHRHSELTSLHEALEPVAEGGMAGTNAHLYGPTGVGKTTVAKVTMENLREERLGVRVAYVDCWRDYSRTKVLYRAVDEATRAVVHRGSTGRDELLDVLDDVDEPMVVILDEVDQLEETKALRDLHSVTGLTMVLIANREIDLMGRLDERVASRLRSGIRIKFDAYRAEQLVDILEHRAELGLRPGVAGKDVLERIALEADGDARLAIGILRTSAQIAQSDHGRITDDVVDEAVPEARDDLKQKNVEKLTDHQRVLYDLLVEDGPMAPGELYDRYAERVDEPKSDRTLRKYVRKMEHYNLVESSGQSQGKRLVAK